MGRDLVGEKLHKKLTKRDPSVEVTAGLITALCLIVVIFAIMETDGWLEWGLIFMVSLQILGLAMKMAGYRSVTLNADEQDYLRERFPRKLDNSTPF